MYREKSKCMGKIKSYQVSDLHIMMSIFAGALSDRWDKKRTMLVCDLIAAFSTVAVLVLLKTNRLCKWHLYALNAFNGRMNTFQQPAGEVAATLLIPKRFYQKTSGLRALSQSLNTILTLVLATALLSFSGIEAVIAADLITFAAAFLTLWLLIEIPRRGGCATGKGRAACLGQKGARVA